MSFIERTVANIILVAFEAWWVMLLLGVLHSDHSAIPAFGYWDSVVATSLVAGLVCTGVVMARD